MNTVNKVILLGQLAADPDFKFLPSGKPVCKLRVLTNELRRDKAGELHERPEVHRVNVWGDEAKLCKRYLKQGRRVYLEGRIQTQHWKAKDNHQMETVEVTADKLVYLDSPDNSH